MKKKIAKSALTLYLILSPLSVLHSQVAQDSVATVALPTSSKTIEVSADIDTATMVIGQQKTLTITATNLNKGKATQQVTFPTLQSLTQGPIEALESVTDTVFAKDGTIERIEQKVTVTTFDEGRHPVAGIIVKVEGMGEAMLLSPADSLYVNACYASDADTTKCEVMADAGYEREKYTFWEIARWVVLALIVAIAVMALIWIVRLRKDNKPIPLLPKAKAVPADRRALNELETLRRKELWQKGRIKKYYTDMTDIVRRFLRNMYGINASEMTTRQTLRNFHNIEDWSDESETLLRQLLQKADMVKFAKSQPESHEHDLAMQNAIDFVRKVAETHKINHPEEGDQKTEKKN